MISSWRECREERNLGLRKEGCIGNEAASSRTGRAVSYSRVEPVELDFAELYGVELDGMELDGVEWDGVEWDGAEWDSAGAVWCGG